jgi:hypothetical protein
MSTGELLRLLGRTDDETVWISTEDPAVDRSFRDHSMPLPEVDGFVDRATAGGLNCWWAVQRYRRDSSSRKGTQVSEMVALYADLDWAYAGKPDGMQPPESLAMIRALSGLLETEPTLVVRSGHGLQPVWAIEPVGASQELLDWFKAHVAHQAGLLGVSVDTGVFNLSRVLRCPGSVNWKIKDGVEYPPEPASMQIRSGKVIDRFVLHGLRQAYPAPKGFDDARETARVKSGVARDSESDRVWTQEQADRYIEERIMDPLRAAPQDGMWMHLWSAAKQLSSFEPRFVSEEAALGMLEAECIRRWGSADSRDWEWINTGWESPDFEARAATEEEKLDVFSPYRDEEKIAARQGGIKAGRPVSAGRAAASAAQVAAADAAVSAVAGGLGVSSVDVSGIAAEDVSDPEIHQRWMARIAEQESRGYFLPDEFWDEPQAKALGHIRASAQAARVSPEGVLLAAMSEVALRIMPNVKIPAYVKTPASLSFGVLLVGGSGSNKSSSVDLAQELFHFDGMDDHGLHYFGLSSSQGIAGQYQHYEKPRSQPGFMKRDRFAAMADEDEGDKIAALCEKNGLDLVSAIRSALMGKLLGAGNVGETKTNLPKHSYRFVLRICTLPAHCGWILSDDVGGLPQRLLWACVEDSRIVQREAPGKFRVSLPAEFLPDPISGGLRPEFMLTADEEVRLEIVRDEELRAKLGVSKLDEHALLTREKVAWIIAAMHGRSHVRADVEWRLAEMVMTMSDAARTYAQSEVQRANLEVAQAQALSKGRGRVIEESVVKAHVETTERTRCSAAVLRFLDRAKGDGITKADLRRKLAADLRPLLDDGVLDGLLDSGQVRFEDIVSKDGKQIGSRWYRT